jgi:hypothetical protein
MVYYRGKMGVPSELAAVSQSINAIKIQLNISKET